MPVRRGDSFPAAFARGLGWGAVGWKETDGAGVGESLRDGGGRAGFYRGRSAWWTRQRQKKRGLQLVFQTQSRERGRMMILGEPNARYQAESAAHSCSYCRGKAFFAACLTLAVLARRAVAFFDPRGRPTRFAFLLFFDPSGLPTRFCSPSLCVSRQ